MTWTKLSDNWHGHPKTRRAWRNPTALGLHVLAMNYATCHELDGHVTPEFVEDQVPDQSDRAGAIEHLIECNLWRPDPNGRGWLIHDFLEYQPSRKMLQEKRDKDSTRKRGERSK